TLWIGGQNANGTLQNPRAGSVAYASVGKYMSDAQATSEAQIVNAFIAAAEVREEVPADDPMMMILNSQQANEVAGRSSVTPLAALPPLALTDGSFFLKPAGLDDPIHGEAHTTLANCPQTPYSTLIPLLPAEAEE